MDISRFSQCEILVVGDLMLDQYVKGEVERISPEAPVPVVTVQSEEYTLGGAGNVVNNLLALGARVSAAGVVGAGPNGSFMLRKFRDLGLTTESIVREHRRPTTRKTRVLAGSQQVLRIDRETIRKISDKSHQALIEAVEKILPDKDIVLISDYGKGGVTRELIADVTAMVRDLGTPVIVDPKGLDFSKYNGVTMITPNKKEAGIAARIDIKDEPTLIEAGSRILQENDIEVLLVTRGSEGMTIFKRDEPPRAIQAEARQVFDVSGAGDTVLAVMGLAMASGAPLIECARVANTAAGIVVGKVGTATVSGQELAKALAARSDEALLKQWTLSSLGVLVKELRKNGKRIVLTNGCFDLLHAGHVKLFSESRKFGDVLIVAIDDDASVASIKGPGRPVLTAGERVRILSAMDSVDYVVIFSSGDLPRLIDIVRPDVLTKGDNYTSREVMGRGLIENLNGRVELIPLTEETSSTLIIDRIRKLER